MKIALNKPLREFVETKLLFGDSPENISGRLKKREKNLLSVGKNSIRRYIGSIYGRKIEYARKLLKKGKKRKKRKPSPKLGERTFIDKRPCSIGKRERIGDAEGDFIVSGKEGKGILLVVADRKSRAPFIEKIIKPDFENVIEKMLRIKERFPELKTMTLDNDILFQKWKEMEKIIGIKIYFCHAYHSWEKGTVENTNKEIRRFIPKGADISKYSNEFVREIENRLQGRIMKCLKYLTPLEVLQNSRKRKRITD